MPSAEPMASPSGRACEVTRKCSRARSSASNSSGFEVVVAWVTMPGSVEAKQWFSGARLLPRNGIAARSGGAAGELLPVLFHAAQQLVHPGADLLGTVDGEGEFRDVPHTHAIADFSTDVATGRHQAGQGVLFFFFAAMHGDENAAGFSARGKHHLRHITGCDPRIGEFTFEHGGDLL